MIVESRTKALKREQERISKRNNITSPPANGNGGRFDRLKNLPSWWWNVILTIVGAGVFWKLYTHGLTLSQVGDWSLAHWVSLGVFFGILFILIALNSQALGKAANVLRWMLVVALVMMFAGFPAWFGFTGWVNTPSSSHSKNSVVHALPQNAPDLPKAWNPDGSITDQSKWPRVLVPAHCDSVRVPSIAGGHIVWGGSGLKFHAVYSDGRTCVLGNTVPCGDGDVVSGYAHNDSDTDLFSSYAYANQGEK